ncbi:MAG TPA: DUF3857 domain-containing protein [Pyrinomonadaceae bacterium]|nr:DUF3857 domain-containing protein [Pyrinomonadaceae bacterium]
MKKITGGVGLCLLALSLSFTVLGQRQEWTPVSQAELSMSKPLVEADADAEAILWDVYVSDEDTGSEYQTVLHHYLKVKIFNDRGREAFSKIDIQFGKIDGIGYDVKIKDIAERTTKADGTTVELKDSDVFERDVVKGSGLKLKAKSFAVPGIEPGAIIEYRWKEVRGAVSLSQRLQFSRDIPVELVRYHLRPVPATTGYGMHGQPFNFNNDAFVKERDGFYMTAGHNLPAFREESKMPPEYSVKPWLLLQYTKETTAPTQEKYWKDLGHTQYDKHRGLMKLSDEVKQATTEAIGSESGEEQKVHKIFDYVRAKVKNYNDDALHLSAEDRKKLKENKSPADTLKRGQGNGMDINMLFASMVTAAGIDARSAHVSRRSDTFFSKQFVNDYFLTSEDVAVKIGGQWRYFDPGSRYVPYGMLTWPEEGVLALIADDKQAIWDMTPISPPKASLQKRVGQFKLLDDGTLEGTVRMEMTGQIAASEKEYNDDDTQQQRENSLKDMVRSNMLASAEVTDTTIENVTDPDKPLIYTFKVRIPDYGTRTGKRIFFQPDVFERSSKPMFEGTVRRNDIYFQYPWAERDEITFELPAGFELESPDSPGLVKDTSGIGADEIKITISADKKMLVYSRDFSFGNRGAILFPKESYPAIKNVFEAFYRADSHALTLKQSASPKN